MLLPETVGTGGDSHIYAVIRTFNQGSLSSGNTYDIEALVPAGNTDYVRLVNRWSGTGNYPSWASDVKGFLLTDPAGTITQTDDGYGIDLLQEDFLLDEDFEVLGISSRDLN